MPGKKGSSGKKGTLRMASGPAGDLKKAHSPALRGFQWGSDGRENPKRTARPDRGHPEAIGKEVRENCRNEGAKIHPETLLVGTVSLPRISS